MQTAVIESEPELSVVGEAGNSADALTAAHTHQPDIILLDLALHGANGLDLIPELLVAAKSARILILTGVFETDEHERAVRLGARGVVLKEKEPEVLIKAIMKVHDGELWLDHSMIASLFGGRAQNGAARKPSPEATKIVALTKREREVITLIGEGLIAVCTCIDTNNRNV